MTLLQHISDMQWYWSAIAEASSASEFSSVEKENQFCDFLRTVLDKHPPLLCGRL